MEERGQQGVVVILRDNVVAILRDNVVAWTKVWEKSMNFIYILK